MMYILRTYRLVHGLLLCVITLSQGHCMRSGNSINKYRYKNVPYGKAYFSILLYTR